MTNGEHTSQRAGHPHGCKCMGCHWDMMGRENRMHFVGMITALIVVFSLGFGLGTVHESHDRHGGYGERGGQMRGDHMRPGDYAGMNGDGYSDETIDAGQQARVFIQDGTTTSAR